MNTFFSTLLTFFLVMDALGVLPVYLTLTQRLDKKRLPFLAVRESCIAFCVMIIFYYVGEWTLRFLQVDYATVEIAGGLILFLIALRLIFSKEESKKEGWSVGKHLIVPIATPLMASPTLFATIMIFSERGGLSTPALLTALAGAWFLSSLIYCFALPIYRGLKERGLMACQRLMGLLVALIAVQMLVKGIQVLFQ